LTYETPAVFRVASFPKFYQFVVRLAARNKYNAFRAINFKIGYNALNSKLFLIERRISVKQFKANKILI